MLRLLDRWATGRAVAIAFAVSLGALVAANAFATLFYTRTGGHGLLDLAGGRNTLDSRPGYTADGAYALMTAWGPAGRRDQVLFTLTGDVLLPLTLFVFTALALRYATGRLGAPAWLRALLVLLPVAYLLSDYAENAAIVTLVLNHPARLDTVAGAAELLRQAKNATSTLALLAALGALALVPLLRRRAAAVVAP
jgi:hypothetical protein